MQQQIYFINSKKKKTFFSPRCNINILRFVNKNWSRDQQGQVIVQVNIGGVTWTSPQRAIILRGKNAIK